MSATRVFVAQLKQTAEDRNKCYIFPKAAGVFVPCSVVMLSGAAGRLPQPYHAQRSGQSSAQRTAQSSGQSSAQARNHHLRDVVRRKRKTEARSVSSHNHVTRSTNDRHRAHPTPRQVDHGIQLSRWGPEQPPPVQDGDRDLGHPGSILPSGGG